MTEPTNTAIPRFIAQLRFEFTPQPDITAYELARCIPYLHGQQIYSEDELGDLKRHFKVHP